MLPGAAALLALKPLLEAKNIKLHVPSDEAIEFKSEKAAAMYQQLIDRGLIAST